MNNFSFEYSGEIQPGQNQKAVTINLAKVFGVSEYEIEPLFSGNHFFIRNQLDEFTANAYLQTFKKCGAVGKVTTVTAVQEKNIEENQSVSPASRQENHCPKCGSHNINHLQCLDCGIYIEKYLKRIQEQKSIDNHETILDVSDIDDQKLRYKATKWLIGASTLLTAVGIIDSFFQDNFVLAFGRVDMGYIPYILVHLVFLRGCFLYATSKGYDSRYGLWGLLSFAGLSILLLLPDKDERYNATSGKQKIYAGLCVGVCIYWLIQFSNTSVDSSHFYTKADMLATGRSEYPSTQLDSENSIYQREHDELITFIQATLKQLEDGNYRSNQVLKISGRMFQEVARYSIWRNYQKYLHTTNQTQLPELLDFNEQEKQVKEISLIFKPLYKNSEPVGEAYINWSSGMTIHLNTNAFWDEFKNYQMRIWDQYKTYAYASREKLGKNTPVTLKDFKIPKHKKIITAMDDYTITFSAAMGPLSKTPVTMALYMGSYTYRGQRKETFYVDIISSELPHRYIQSPFNEIGKFNYF